MENIRWWLFVGASIFALTGVYILWGPSQRPKKRRKGMWNMRTLYRDYSLDVLTQEFQRYNLDILGLQETIWTDKDAVPGLQNLGNSCFLNAVLQALASCPLVIRWLKSATSTTAENENGNSNNLATSLLSILTELNIQTETCENVELCDPTPVIKALRARRWVISNEEQDAHELFHVLTTTLEEEFAATPPVLSLLEVGKLEENSKALHGGCSQKTFITPSVNSAVKYTSPTRGLLASQLKCKRCGFRYPVRYDTFDSISLAIPTPHWGQLQLQDCLQKFITCELVDDVTCDDCTKHFQLPDDTKVHEAKTTFIKQLVFGKLPECLCIHIQRTVWLNNGMPMKCFDHIAFPEFLAMDDYVYSSRKKNKNEGMVYPWARLIGGGCLKDDGHQIPLTSPLSPSKMVISQPAILSTLQNQSQYAGNTISCMLPVDKSFGSQTSEHMYMLKAVIVHLGDMFSGHFITYRRGPVDSHARHKWFCTSDSTVKEVSLSKVLQDCAYMLFYEKITLNK